MRRMTTALGIVMLMPLLLGAGGSLPPPFASKVAGHTYQFVAVLDPHMADGDFGNSAGDVTPKAKQATIAIIRNHQVAAAVFKIVGDFPLFRGCNLSLTDDRFRYPNGTLRDWIPLTILQALFTELGEGISDVRLPVITRIEEDRCTFDPEQPSIIADGGDGASSLPGVLSIRGAIRFAVPK